ncbi:hypothetical protein ACLOJK_009971 [Asimina triloba]
MELPLCQKASVARRNRLAIRRLRSAGLKQHSGTDAQDDSDALKRRRDEGSRGEDRNSSSSDSASSSEFDIPIGILASGGEMVGDCAANVPCRSHGSVSICGRRREMEDAVTIAQGFAVAGKDDSARFDFFAVYDGHGGSPVAYACRDRLHRIVAREIESRAEEAAAGKLNWKEMMDACFAEMDEEVGPETAAIASSKTVGSTALVAVVGTECIVVANCGDSRAVISRGGAAIPLSRDHKGRRTMDLEECINGCIDLDVQPDRPDEMERVEAAGGRVINWDGYRVLGVLAMSRSIGTAGDHYLKPFVISEPEVVVSKRTDKDEFLILASDGLWDVVTNEIACEVARRCLTGSRAANGFDQRVGVSGAAEAAAVLVEIAMGRGSGDNISVVVVELNKSSSDDYQ